MSPLLLDALNEARPLVAERGWQLPAEQTLSEADRLLALVGSNWRAPVVSVEPDGTVSLEWDAGAHGWLKLTVAGAGTLAHSAVIEGDDYEQTEPFGDALPDWAHALLGKLLGVGH
jgi:hypothetical protein